MSNVFSTRRRQYRSLSRAMLMLALLAMAFTIWSPSTVLALDGSGLAAVAPVLVGSQPVTAGVIMREYDWDVAEGPAKIYVMVVDLQHPYLQVAVIPGGGKLTQRTTVSDMAASTGAVAAVNADFFNTQAEGAPIGPMVIDGDLVASPSFLTDIYALGITADHTAHIESFTFLGRVVAPDGQQFPLSGLNKTTYWEERGGVHSHASKLHLYNDMWGGQTRGDDSYTTPTEMLINQGSVVDISRGEYFDFAVPEGMLILRGHGQAAKFLDSFQIGDPIYIDYAISPEQDWSMMVGGHSLLVDEGKAVPYLRYSSALGGIRARSAAGVSQDGRTLYLVAVEGRTASSAGLSLTNLSTFLETLGVWKALNLDGGGSTTMVARPLGESETAQVFAPEQASERQVVNAIGVYSHAPKGALQGFILDGHGVVLIGEQAAYDLRAYDQYFNPLSTAGLGVKWTALGTTGNLRGNLFTAQSAGAYRIRAAVGSVHTDLSVQVVGKRDLSALKLVGGLGQVVSGSEVPLSLTLDTVSGRSRQVPVNLVNWQCYGFDGSVSPEGVLTVRSIAAGGHGFLVARYQGYSAPLVLQFAREQSLDRLDTLTNVEFRGQPEAVSGRLTLSADPQGLTAPVTRLDYDFSQTTGTAAAYLQFGDSGLALDSGAQALLVDVYGNNAGEWLRAELQDATGVIHRVDLAARVNWSGWRTLQFDLESIAHVGCLSLKRIYPVVTAEQLAQRPVQGTLYFGNLRQQLPPAMEQPPAAPSNLLLTVGDRSISIDGAVSEMDVAPVIVADRAFVPVRFISEALQAQIAWNGATKDVTIIQDKRWIDLWPGDKLMVVDGVRVDLDVAPQIIGSRTMLPLRAVAQALDLNVQWDPVTRQIVLQK